jgi:hypothetical protein
MTSEFILSSIKTAKEYLDKVGDIGEMGFNQCDGILSNLKSFIHDEVIWRKIQEKEEKVYKEFQKKTNEAKTKLKDIDSLLQWNEGARYYAELRQWKSIELLSFWDKLSKEYDL